MMPQIYTGEDVFEAAVQRMVVQYEAGHRIVVSFSGGKDSTCALEICLVAARRTGRLPVEVIMRDEEIMFPGTFEYAQRVYDREDVKFYWGIGHQAIVNIFNRREPYYWVFDDRLEPAQWMRQPPPHGFRLTELCLVLLVNRVRFPPPEGKELVDVLGLRVAESPNRKLGLYSSRGYMTKAGLGGQLGCRPLYDWKDGDVWKAIKDHGWDYNSAYDAMMRYGIDRRRVRIAPPLMMAAGTPLLQVAAKAWPRWFDRLCSRCPGARLAAKYGKRVLAPIRRLGETWEQVFQRECIDDAPSWIRERAVMVRDFTLEKHEGHSSAPLGDAAPCLLCPNLVSNWRGLATVMYTGDPFLSRLGTKGDFRRIMGDMSPSYFRPGSGEWEEDWNKYTGSHWNWKHNYGDMKPISEEFTLDGRAIL